MTKIYLKNTYFNNNSISIHLGETSTSYFVEINIDNRRKITKFSKKSPNHKERSTLKFNKELTYISSIINSTNFVTIK